MADESDIYLTGDETDSSLPADLARKAPSALDEVALYQQLKSWFMIDDRHSQEWRDQAMADFDFAAGDQWLEKTYKALEAEGRAPLTFNYTAPFLEAVKGLEIGTRHETVFLPREVEEGEILANETISDTSRWMGDLCNAEDEQSESFGDVLTCGMGWTESRFSYEEGDPDGQYMEEKLDPLEMRWDCSARKKNLSDAKRVWRVREMPLDEAREMFPNASDGDLNAPWALGYEPAAMQPKSEEERRLKLENSHPLDPQNRVHIVQVQWIERECYYRVAFSEGIEEVSEVQFKEYKALAKEAGVKLVASKQYRKVRRQAFLGAKVLGLGPCPDPNRFTLQCITGKLHKRKGTFYGLIRMMRDPQQNANKWLSQALHILNSTAKGGILAERGAFKSLADAQRTYANPQAITLVEDGAIQKGRIMQKPGAGLAAPYVQLTQMAVQAIPGVTGLNLELLGLRDANQPGVLEAQRKQAGMTILATVFDALKLYRKTNGETRLHFIQTLVPDGKIIRVKGPTGAKAIRFIRDKHLGRYDVVVSDAPTSPNQKELTWTMLMQLSQVDLFKPLLSDPETAVECLEYCPLPAKIVQLLKKGIQAPKPQQEQQQQIAIADAVAKIRKTQADAGKAEAGAGLDRARTVLTFADAAVKQQQAQRDAAMNRFNAALLRGGVPGMPPRMPPAPADEGFAVADLGESGLPLPPELPMAPSRGRGMAAAADEDIASLFDLPPGAQGGPAAASPMQ
jgi:hypothetical protein